MISNGDTASHSQLNSSYKGRPLQHISWRAVIFALLVIPLNTYWIALTEMVWSSLHFTAASLPLNVIFILTCLLLYNAIARYLHPRLAFSEGELLVIYIILATSSALSGYDSLIGLMGVLPHTTRYATLENDWVALFGRYLPKWFIITEPNAVRDFYVGETSFFEAGYWQQWLVPALNWSVLVILLVFILLCITIVLRRPWTEEEKLTYPIIQLPLEMSHSAASLFKSRLMWIGFVLAALVDIINGLNYLYPSVPYIPVRGIELQHYFTNKPWNAIGRTPIRFRFFMIGMIYLLPVDLSISCWFFYLVSKAERIFGSAVGWSNIPGYPFDGQQAMGGLLGIAGVTLFAIRRHLKKVCQKALLNRGIDDTREPIGYRFVLVGIVISSVLLGLFCLRIGLSLWVVTIFFVLFLIMCVAMARIRAEIGVPEHAMSSVVPQDSLVMFLGTRAFGPRNLARLSLFVWFSARKRSYLMPHQLEAFKISERVHLSNRGIFWLLLLATVAGLVASFSIFPLILYRYGAEARAGGMIDIGWMTFNRLASWLQFPRSPDWIANTFLAGGVSTTFFLTFLRRKFIWWPFHPAGYVLAMSDSISDYWFTIVVASTIKWLVLRHGGAKSYRRSLPFFLGLILGDYLLACGWALLGVLLNRPMYVVWA